MIEISSQKKLAERQRHWESEGYEAPEISTVYEIRYGEVFQVRNYDMQMKIMTLSQHSSILFLSIKII